MPTNTFSPSTVARMTGVSLAAIRAYCERYAAYLSPGASPPKGAPREFTAADIKTIAFIRDRTRPGQVSHEEVIRAIEAGELAEFTWSAAAPADAEQDPQPQAQTQPQAPAAETGLITGAQVQALQVLLDDYRRREETLQARTLEVAAAAQLRERELHDQIAALQRELGKAEGELSALKQRRPWWRFWT